MSDAILCLWNMDGIEDNGSKLYIRIFCFSSCFTNEERWMFWTPSTCHALYKLWGLFLCSSVYITNEKLSNGMTIFSFSFCLSFRRKRQQTSRMMHYLLPFKANEQHFRCWNFVLVGGAAFSFDFNAKLPQFKQQNRNDLIPFCWCFFHCCVAWCTVSHRHILHSAQLSYCQNPVQNSTFKTVNTANSFIIIIFRFEIDLCSFVYCVVDVVVVVDLFVTFMSWHYALFCLFIASNKKTNNNNNNKQLQYISSSGTNSNTQAHLLVPSYNGWLAHSNVSYIAWTMERGNGTERERETQTVEIISSKNVSNCFLLPVHVCVWPSIKKTTTKKTIKYILNTNYSRPKQMRAINPPS